MVGQALPDGTREALLFLSVAGVAVPVFSRLRVSPVLGFLLAGILIGPYGLGALAAAARSGESSGAGLAAALLSAITITDPRRIGAMAELGVVFLLFMVGLELSFQRLSRMRRLVFGLGGLQVVVSAAAIAGCAAVLGFAPATAIVIGFALSLSSTAVAVPVLAERKRLNSAAGRTAFSVLLFQDLAVAPLLFTVSALSSVGGGSLVSNLLFALAPAVGAMAALVVAGRLVLRPLFGLVAATRSTEFFMAASLLVVVGTGVLTAASGLSMSLGAFVAGLLLAETEFRREIEVTIEPFKGLLLGLFFVSIGLELDIGTLFADPWRLLAMVVGLVVLKGCILFALARAFRLTRQVALEVALVLGPSGEFAFVMFAQSREGGILADATAHDLVAAVTLSMLLLPVLARIGERLGRSRRPPGVEAYEPPPDSQDRRVILVGYGRVGRLVGEMVKAHDLPFIAIDDDLKLVRREREAGTPIYYGDATKREFLDKCGLGQARALVVTLNNPRIAELVVEAARAQRTDLTLVARARDAAHAHRLYGLGATDAVPETIEASLQLSEAVLVDIGVPMGYVIASIHAKRDEFRALLNAPRADGRERRAIRRPLKSR